MAAGEGEALMESKLSGHTGPVNAVAFSPFGRWIVTGSQDFTARIWDAKEAKTLRIFGEDGGAHLGGIKSVAWKPPPTGTASWKPDMDQVLTGSEDGTAKLWMAHTGELQHTFNHGGKVNSVGFSPDGSQIITGSSDGTAKIWSLSTFKSSTVVHGNQVTPVKMTRHMNQVVFDPSVSQITRDQLMASYQAR